LRIIDKTQLNNVGDTETEGGGSVSRQYFTR